jgi:hypothetical protein
MHLLCKITSFPSFQCALPNKRAKVRFINNPENPFDEIYHEFYHGGSLFNILSFLIVIVKQM